MKTLKSYQINITSIFQTRQLDPPSIGMGELKDRAVTVGTGVFVLFTRIQGASSPSTQYTPESMMLPAQQSSAVVPGMLAHPAPPQNSHVSGQQTVPIPFSTPLRPLEQLDGAISAS